jgi:general secretion pathway protein F
MPLYEYRGLSKNGKNVKGTLDSDNLRTARLKLKKDGVYVVDIKDKKKSSGVKKSAMRKTGSVPIKDLSLMTRQLATLIKANIPLVDALTAISEQVENPILSEAISDCKNMVNEGQPLYKSLAKYPNIFNVIYISMTEAGEMSGTLDTILLRLAEFTEAQADLNQKVKGAMVMPVIQLVIMVAAIFFLFIKVVPEIMAIFESMPGVELPYMTMLVSDISKELVARWYIYIGVIVIAVLFFINWKNSSEGRKSWDAIILKIPVLGDVTRMIAISRFTRTLSTLLTGGVPMLTAMDIVRNVVDNHVLALAIDEARSNISEGESIAGPLKKSEQFPPIVIHMVNIGEKTGDLENMLTLVADAYDFQVKTKVETLTTIINPVMLVLMGLIVSIIFMAIMVPMFELSNKLG